MTDNKYEKIINNNPAESYLKSIKTKQAWDKYAYNFKSGMQHRKRMDKLTGNKEDKFGLKEQTKKEYCNDKNELSTTRLGKALKKLKVSSLKNENNSIYMIIEEHPLTKKPDYFYGHLIDKKGSLGNFEYCTNSERFPEYIYIEDMHREREDVKGIFAQEVFSKLQEKYKDTHKGIVLIPVNKTLEEFYKRLDFVPYKTIEEDIFYKKDF